VTTSERVLTTARAAAGWGQAALARLLVCALSATILLASWLLVIVAVEAAPPAEQLEWPLRMVLAGVVTLVLNIPVSVGLIRLGGRFNSGLRGLSSVRLALFTGVLGEGAGSFTLYQLYAYTVRAGWTGGGGGHGAGAYFMIFLGLSALATWLAALLGAVLGTRRLHEPPVAAA